jgi:hypothetical protein
LGLELIDTQLDAGMWNRGRLLRVSREHQQQSGKGRQTGLLHEAHVISAEAVTKLSRAVLLCCERTK